MENQFLESFLGDPEFYDQLFAPESQNNIRQVDQDDLSYTMALIDPENATVPQNIMTANTLFTDPTSTNLTSIHPVGESTGIPDQNEPV